MSSITPELHHTITELRDHIIADQGSDAWKSALTHLFVGLRPEVKSTNVLQHWQWFPLPNIFLLELNYRQEINDYSLRIYPDFAVGQGDNLFIPSIIVGTKEKIHRMATRDGQVPSQLQHNSDLHFGEEVISSSWIIDQWNAHTTQESEPIWFYIRPCTFVLSSIIDPSPETRIKLYENRVQTHHPDDAPNQYEWFAHISSPDESTVWFETHFVHYLIALTNSHDYQNRHPEWEWYLVE